MMPDLNPTNERIGQLRRAFEKDGFEVGDGGVVQHAGRIGIVATHRTAKNNGTGEPKRAYYVEGSAREMGYLMGRMAEPEIRKMAEGYIERYAWEMLPFAAKPPESLGEGKTRLYREMVDRVYEVLPPDEPKETEETPKTPLERRIEEMRGMAEGCKDANSDTDIDFRKLWALNAGVDRLFSLLYEAELGELIFGKKRKKARKIESQIGCNGLAVLNDAAEDGALFARDFMFKACDVFQDVACHVIYRPIRDGTDEPLPMVALTAPGFVGSISAMNVHGVAAGVDVVHGGNNDPDYLGMNSLLLVRDAVEHGATIEAAATRIVETPRGVTWLYPMAADGGEGPDRACVVEASATPRDNDGNRVEHLRFLDFPNYPRRELEGLLPNQTFLTAHPTATERYGAMVRWEEFENPSEYIETFNERLWKRRLRPLLAWGKVRDQFGPEGRIDVSHRDWRCPSGSYFAPLRGEPGTIVLSSNHYVCPEMRLTAMDTLTNWMDNRYADDSQWRYDELNHLVVRARWYDAGSKTRRETPKPISYEKTKELINFLEPDCPEGKCKASARRECYHYKKYEPYECRNTDRGRYIPIEGAISLFDLRRRTIDSYFGYYGDEWVKLSLMSYVDGTR